MAQFDVCRNPRRGLFPLLLDVQSDLLSELVTRVVVPLIARARHEARPLTRLNPTARFQGVDYVLLFQELAALPRSQIGQPLGSLKSRRDELIAALDLLFTGI